MDVNPEAVRRLRAEGGLAEAIGAAAPGLQAVVVVVLNAAQVEAVLFGAEGLAPKLPQGAVVICCVTVAPEFARTMAARCAALGLLYLDAPISGGSVKAAAGKLTIMASGTAAATRHASCDASKWSIARVPLRPSLTARQNTSRPTPNGDTTPIPVMATRGDVRDIRL